MAQKEPDTQKPHRNDKKVCSTVFFRIMQPELYQLPGRAVAHPEKQADHCRHRSNTVPKSRHCSSSWPVPGQYKSVQPSVADQPSPPS